MFAGIKKETLIVIFYVMYFTWLFTVTYLTQDTKILNSYSIIIAGFYFLFLKETGDFLWFFLGCVVSIGLSSLENLKIHQLVNLDTFTVWLPITWGTTFVALRKLAIVLEKDRS